MIYLIITTSIINRFGIQNAAKRKTEYLAAITESLSHLPEEIQPIIVENNGERDTYLDHFTHAGTPVSVLYTTNNNRNSNKGMIELLDIKEVITQFGIRDDDMVIKLTGRYTVKSPEFFKEVQMNPHAALVKFYNVCTFKFDPHDAVLGLYAVQASLLKYWSHLTMNYYPSAEVAFAHHIRLHTTSIKEIQWLDLDCTFAEDYRQLRV
jgi:hypothetical protein